MHSQIAEYIIQIVDSGSSKNIEFEEIFGYEQILIRTWETSLEVFKLSKGQLSKETWFHASSLVGFESAVVKSYDNKTTQRLLFDFKTNINRRITFTMISAKAWEKPSFLFWSWFLIHSLFLSCKKRKWAKERNALNYLIKRSTRSWNESLSNFEYDDTAPAWPSTPTRNPYRQLIGSN